MDPVAFWCQTPRLYHITLSAKSRAVEREQQGRAWLAWHIAALPRVKKFPTLENLMGVKSKARRQTVSEMEAIFKAWAKRG